MLVKRLTEDGERTVLLLKNGGSDRPGERARVCHPSGHPSLELARARMPVENEVEEASCCRRESILEKSDALMHCWLDLDG